jgi:hypothetical protein
MKRLDSKELKSLNECAYHTMSNEQLDESILGAIGRGLFSAARGTGKAALRSTTSTGRAATATSLERAARGAYIGGRKAYRDIKDTVVDIASAGKTGRLATKRASSAARQAAAETARVSKVTRDVQDAIAVGRRGQMTAADALRVQKAEDLLAAGRVDDAFDLLMGGGQKVISGSGGGAARSGASTALAAGAGTAAGAYAGGKDGFLSSNFSEIEQAAQKGASENIFGDLRTTLALQGKATGSRINVQNRLRGTR